MSVKHPLNHNRLVPERKASTGARDRSRAIPSPQCLLLVYRTSLPVLSCCVELDPVFLSAKARSCCDPTATRALPADSYPRDYELQLFDYQTLLLFLPSSTLLIRQTYLSTSLLLGFVHKP